MHWTFLMIYALAACMGTSMCLVFGLMFRWMMIASQSGKLVNSMFRWMMIASQSGKLVNSTRLRITALRAVLALASTFTRVLGRRE